MGPEVPVPRQKSKHRDAIGSSSADETFRQIFFRFYRPVLAFFRNRGIPDEESRDLTQETFLRIFRGMHDYRGDTIAATWVFEIASGIYRNQLRQKSAHKRRAVEIALDVPPAPDQDIQERLEAVDDPLAAILEQERARKLREALDGLPDQMRLCVLLRVEQDLKYREIADLMRVSIETVKSHLFQARQKLKDELGDYFLREP